MALIMNTDDTVFKKILDSIPEEDRDVLISPCGVAYLSKLVAEKHLSQAPNVAISRARQEYSTPVAKKSKFVTEKSQAPYLVISSAKRSREEYSKPDRRSRRKIRSRYSKPDRRSRRKIRSSSSKRSREEYSKPDRRSRRKIRSNSPSRPKIIKKSSMFLKKDDFRLIRGGNVENSLMAEEPFNASKVTRNIAPVDLPNRDKVSEVPEYISDIMQRLFERELHSRPHPYMKKQTGINANMRSIVIAWLSKLNFANNCDSSVFYLSTNICDRYLQRVVVDRTKFQLVGVTAFLIACKAEEIYPPSVQECADWFTGIYTPQEILDMEKSILRELKHQVSVPTGYPFLLRFLYITKATEIQRNAAHYYMEIMVHQHASLKYRPSLIAASCVVLALNNKSIRSSEKIEGIPAGMPKVLRYYTGFALEEVREVANEVCICVNDSKVREVANEVYLCVSKNKWVAKKKYASIEFYCVSTLFDGPDVLDILDNSDEDDEGLSMT